jgi:Zn-finger protein
MVEHLAASGRATLACPPDGPDAAPGAPTQASRSPAPTRSRGCGSPRKQKDQLHHDLVLLHRLGPAKWSEETLVAENPAADKTCDFEPGGPGQVCAFDYVRLYPLALFTATTEVRAVYTAINFKGTMVSDCKNMPFPICVWVQQTDTSTADLRIGWPGSAPEEHAVIASDVFTDRATGRLDSGGYMHLGFHDQAPGTSDPVVRYLAIGP